MYQEQNDVSGLYKMAKLRMGVKKSGKPTFFTINGKMVTSPIEIANIQNDYFHSKIQKFTRELPQNNEDPLKYLKEAIKRWGVFAKNRPIFTLRKITVLETLELLKKLGKYFIWVRQTSLSIKIVASTLAKPLTFLINLSIESEMFSMKWKISKIVPLYKGKGKLVDNPSGYRPINIVPVCSKLVEMAVAKQIKDFMELSGQWNPSNQAYRRNGSTTTTLLHITDLIYQACDESNIATAITVDESAAFDCVSFEILDKKLEQYNFDSGVRNWIQSYLRNRTNYVNIGSANSNMKTTSIGVPQGTVLGPMLFSIYINEMSDIINEYSTCNNDVHIRPHPTSGMMTASNVDHYLDMQTTPPILQ